jgi:hypothetical protein
MAEVLEFEKADEHGNPDKRYIGTISHKPQKPKFKRPHFETDMAVTLGSSDEDDHDFECPEESDSDSDSVSDLADILPSNAEVLHLSIYSFRYLCVVYARLLISSLPKLSPRQGVVLLQNASVQSIPSWPQMKKMKTFMTTTT